MKQNVLCRIHGRVSRLNIFLVLCTKNSPRNDKRADKSKTEYLFLMAGKRPLPSISFSSGKLVDNSRKSADSPEPSFCLKYCTASKARSSLVSSGLMDGRRADYRPCRDTDTPAR